MSFVATLQKNLLKERRRLKLLWLALVLSISLCHQAAFASALSQLAASLQPGQFAELTGMINFNGGDALLSFGTGCGLGDYVTEYANKAVWNPISKRFQFEGAPHGNCSVDQLVIYDEATNAWSYGTPAISGNGLKHSYDHNAINPATGDHYYRPYNSKSVFKLPNGGSWSSIASVPMSSIQCCGALEWFPDQGRLIFIDGDWGGWSYDPGSNSWTHLFRTNGNDGSGLPQYPMASYTNFAEYSKLGFLVFGGGQNIYKMNSSGTVNTIAPAPFGNVNVGTGSTCCSVAADPVTGDIVVIDGSRRVWKLNPSSGTWTNTGIVAPAYFSQNVGVGESLISAPISAYGVIMYVKCDDASSCKVYLYKHTASTSGGGTTPSDTQAPTAPTGLSIFAISSSQINLSWTASTDNVGVTGYYVEQCQGSGCSNFSQIATPSGTTLNNTGLAASTSYSYRVRATDAAGNVSGYSTVVSATTQAAATADTQAPTTPANLTATVFSSNQINLTWTASTDNVGVTGYRVERCQGSGCSNFGQLMTSPGTTFTDAGLSASTSYSYRLRATDAAGNLSGYSAVVSATTQGGGTASSSASTSDFAARCATPGVLRCFGFDSSADFADADPGAGHNRCWGCNYGIGPNGNVATIPTLDTSVKASGAGSMLFTINSNTGSSGAGNWFTNFTPDLQGFGQGQTFFIQWRQRFDPNYVNYDFRGSAGKKLVIIGAVDKPTCVPGAINTTNCPSSCTDIEVVPTAEDAGSRNDIVTAYNSCVTFAGFEYFDGTQVTKQNAVPNCYYPNFLVPPCVRIWPNEWMTFKAQISIGTWNQPNSTFRLWVGREGQPTVKIIDFSPASGHPWTAYRNDASHLYGKVWLLPYATGKDSTETHPTAYTWYDELIISTGDIADPSANSSGIPSAPVAPSALTVR